MVCLSIVCVFVSHSGNMRITIREDGSLNKEGVGEGH